MAALSEPAKVKLVLIAAFVAGAVLAATAACHLQQVSDKAGQAEAMRTIAEGRAAAGREAVVITAGRGDAERAIDAVTRDNEKEIRNAAGADAAVDPALAAAGLHGLCRHQAYRDESGCLQQPGP